MSSSDITPVITGLAIGVAFVVFFALIFNSITPIANRMNLHRDILPLPQIMMIDYNGHQYAGNITTFSWNGDFAFSRNVSDSFGYAEENGETTITLGKGSIVSFIARNYHDSNATRMTYRLPVTVYVYHYPSNSFEGMLEKIHGTSRNQSSFVVDMIDEGDYYLRVNHQNPEVGGGSISYYFKIRVT